MKKLLVILLISVNPGVYGQYFTDVTGQSGISVPPSLGHLVVWIDIDNDQWLDFYGSSGGDPFFFRNNGDGTFTSIIEVSGLSMTNPESVSAGDYDNDGYTDLLIASNNISEPVKVYRNNEGNGFSVAFSGMPADRAIWTDYNGDGLLDFFCNRGDESPLLYKGNSGGGFVDISNSMSFVPVSGNSSAAADYNNDGFTDIYCAVSGQNKLYANAAGADFIEVSLQAHVNDFRDGVGQSWGDYNKDGWMDLYVANINSNRNVLYKNNTDGTFTDLTLVAGVADAGDARTCTWVDVNNDGHIDLFTTNHVNPNRLFRNNGNGTFTDIASGSGIASPQDGFGVSWGDFDRDGDQDVLICGHSYAVRLFRNDGGNNNNYLYILLSGTTDNKNGIGARVRVYSGNQCQTGEVNAGTGSSGQDATPLHFGLGSDATIDSLIVSWPGGMQQRLYNTGINQQILIEQQGSTAVSHIPVPDILRFMAPQPARSKMTLSFDIQRSLDVNIFIYNSMGGLAQVFPPHGINQENQQIELDISGLVAGIYLLRVEAQEYSTVKRFIKVN